MTDIPATIAEVIRAKTDEKQRADEEALRKAQAELEAQIERNADEWEELYQVVHEALPLVADYIRPYSSTDGPSRYTQCVYFDVPGLTPIRTDFHKQDTHWVQKRSRDGWYEVVRYEEDYPNEYASCKQISWRWWWNANSIEDALLLAAQSEREHQELIAQHEDRRHLAEADERAAGEREAAQELKAETDRSIEADERATLFGVLMDDPVAVALVKVFAAVRAGRSGYEETIAALNDNLYEMDARYSRKLGEERKNTDDARRDAVDARMEADSQRTEVYDLEAKLKKARKGAA